MIELVIVADDLTGAADAAVPFAGIRDTAVLVDACAPWPTAEVLAVNTESRHSVPDDAARSVGHVVELVAKMGGVRTFKKIDSLLRGNVGSEIAAALRELRAAGRAPLAIVAPAFPGNGRITRGGIVFTHGEAVPAERQLGRVLGEAGLAHQVIGIEQWPDVHGLTARLVAAVYEGMDAVVVDAATDHDLADIVAAAQILGDDAFFVGSGGLAIPLAASITCDRPGATRVTQPPLLRSATTSAAPLVVIGSYAHTSTVQRDTLIARDFVHVHLHHPDGAPADRIEVHETVRALRDALGRGPVVLTPDPRAAVDKARAHSVAIAMAATVAAVIDETSSIVVSGGETAAAILGRLEATTMRLRGEILPGVVVSELPGIPHPFVTKSGSFGDHDALVAVVTHLENHTIPTAEGARS